MQEKFACIWVSYFPRRNICTSVIRKYVYNQELILLKVEHLAPRSTTRRKLTPKGFTGMAHFYKSCIPGICVHPHDAQVLRFSILLGSGCTSSYLWQSGYPPYPHHSLPSDQNQKPHWDSVQHNNLHYLRE